MKSDLSDIFRRIKKIEDPEFISKFESPYGNIWPLIRFNIFQSYTLRRLGKNSLLNRGKKFLKKIKHQNTKLADNLTNTLKTSSPSIEQEVDFQAVKQIWFSISALRHRYRDGYNQAIDPYFNYNRKGAIMIEINQESSELAYPHPILKGVTIYNLATEFNQSPYNRGRKKIIFSTLAGLMKFRRRYRLGKLKKIFPEISSFALVYEYQIYKTYYLFFKDFLTRFKNLEDLYLCSYYFSHYAGMVSAANQLGIITIEIQHGTVSANHYAYGGWGQLPPTGFLMLPKLFWVYAESERELIEKEFLNTPHKVKVVGDLSFIFWNEFRRKNDNPIEKDKIVGLFSMQNRLPDEHHFFWELLQNTDLRFIIRLHPGYRELKKLFLNQLQKWGMDADQMVWDQNEDVFDTLNNCQFHVTLFSSVTLDALHFKIPTFLIDETGYVYFRDLIDQSDLVYYCPTKDSILEPLNKLRPAIKK